MGLPKGHDPSLGMSCSAPPSVGQLGAVVGWTRWWELQKALALLHLLHLIDFLQKEKKINKPIARMKLLIKRPSD